MTPALADALAAAARLAAICERESVLIVQAVPRGQAARSDTVVLSAYTEVCFDNMDLRRENERLRARLAALEPDDAPEFPADDAEGAPV